MTALVPLTVTVAAAFVVLGAAKLLAVPSMRARAAHVGFSVDAYRRIGALELAGAAGLVAAVALPGVGAAAGVGLLLLLLGAVTAHLRAGDSIRGAAPALLLAVLVAVLLVLAVGALR